SGMDGSQRPRARPAARRAHGHPAGRPRRPGRVLPAARGRFPRSRPRRRFLHEGADGGGRGHGRGAVTLAWALGIRQPARDSRAAAFFADAKPWAFILFREACETRIQVTALTAALREAAGHDAVVFIDQEGGRVARLKAPEWPLFPPARAYGDLHGLSE